MRVESTSSSLTSSASSTSKIQQQPVQSSTAQKPQEANLQASNTDKLDISKTSAQLKKSTESSQQSDFRADKVAEIKKSLNTNEYKVNSRDIADKMLYSFSRGPTA
jgi:flagellar biosynthesis anti-sigma factor FlgM